MGIVNRTPDSFFDGGAYLGDNAARTRIRQLVAEGADIVDLGAESSRPSAPRVGAADQITRLTGLIPFTVELGVTVSVDTQDPAVAAWALEQGATMINSVSPEPAAALGRLAARHGAALVLTHCRGSMTDMSGFSVYRDEAYGDVVADVCHEWRAAAQGALDAGLTAQRLFFDPGLGFTKNAAQSLELCARLDELLLLGFPVLVGPSRKSYIGHVAAAELGLPEVPAPAERLGGSIAAAVDCAARGASIVRVHDVAPVRQALAYAAALERVSRRRPKPNGAAGA